MHLGQYVETGVCDEDHLVASSRGSRMRERAIAPWCCALLLVVVGYGGKGAYNLSVDRFNSNEAIEFAIDLSDSKITLPMDILGIYYGGLTSTQKDDFTTIVEKAIAKKGKIDELKVDVRETSIKSEDADADEETAQRTEFMVDITVPDELSAQALQNRLRDGGDLLKNIKVKLIDSDVPHTNVVVQSQPMKIEQEKVAVDEQDAHDPIIILDMDIKGIYYDKLSAAPELRQKFAEAVQAGIATHGLDAKSVGLDVSKGGSNADIPFVHVTAKIPVPPGLSADATMSKWPDGGGEQIGQEVQKNLIALGGCFEQVTRNADQGPHKILVYPGTLHLGAVRETYATHVKVGVDVQHLRHTAVAGKQNVEQADILAHVLDSLKKMAQVEKDDIKLTNTVIPAGSEDEIKYKFTIKAHGSAAAAMKASDWEAKLLPAGRVVQHHFEQTAKTSITDEDDYMVLVGIGDVGNDVDTVDLDLVVHGVDYYALMDDRKKSFLTKFAEAVREGLKTGTSPNTYIVPVKDDIHVTISPHKTSGALNVRAQIPAPDTDAHRHALMSALEDSIFEDPPNTLQKKVEDQVEAIPGIEFVSTWTTHAIHVSVPGKIDDFAGDAAGGHGIVGDDDGT